MQLSTISLAITRLSGKGGFDSSDLANGTLVLDFINRPSQTLSLDATTNIYQLYENDSTSSLAGPIGYYQIKG